MILVVNAKSPDIVPSGDLSVTKTQKNKNKKAVPVDTLYRDGDVVYMTVPQKLKINDKIFLSNKSPNTIVQAAVGLLQYDGTTIPLGTASMVGPGQLFEMASFNGNWLRNIRGRIIGIKMKGLKGVSVDANLSQSLDLKEIDPSQITYDFMPMLTEKDHDLYITVSSETMGLLDF